MTLQKNDIITAGTISPSLQRICFNTIPNQLTSLTTATVNNVSSTITYRWEISINGAAGPYLPIPGAEGPTQINYTPSALTTNTWFQRVSISELNGIKCEEVTTPPVEVRVIENLSGGSILPSDQQLLCFGLAVQPLTLSVTGSLSGAGITYQWQSSPNGINGWVDIGPEQGPNFTPPTLLNTSTLYYRRVTKANGGGPNCEEFSNTHVIYVNDTNPGIIDVNSVRTSIVMAQIHPQLIVQPRQLPVLAQ